MNGHTLDTLREMSQKEKIPPSVAMPIMFGAMADMTAAITAIGKNQEDSKNEREKMSTIWEDFRMTCKGYQIRSTARPRSSMN